MKLKFGTWSLTPYLIVVLLVGLQACGGGGGGSSTPVTPANANPIGYYAGTLSTVLPSQTDITAKAIVDSDKFLLVHIDNVNSNSLLYIGTFTNITATTFTADVVIYHNGVKLSQVASVTNGSITEQSSLRGTMSGSGYYTSTSFSLTYDTTVNSRATTDIERANGNQWLAPNATASTGLSFPGFSYSNSSIMPALLHNCGTYDAQYINVAGEQMDRIQKYVNLTLISDDVDECSTTNINGYITPYDNGGPDNRYLWINYNSTVFFVADELFRV